ncbi:MAG: hypothetical protein HQL39_19045, partial [Alphaproteobacteria bacterium]|nr:hypothetical protein [Alphaproteobacteria bacterium]
MTRKQRRLNFVLLGMLALGAATALVLTAFNDSRSKGFEVNRMNSRKPT